MLSTTQKNELKEMFGEEVGFDVSLSQYTSIHVGGPADAIVWPANAEQIQKVILWAKEKKIPAFILGKGSNTLIRDKGFRGIVITLGKGFREFSLAKEEDNFVWVKADGGVPTQQFVRWCAEQGFAGAERLAGIPGTIGGNIFMNAGTYLGEVGDLVEEVQICDAKGKIQTLPKEKLEFEYRHSSISPSAVVLSTVLKLEKTDKEKVEKKVREVFEKRGLSQPIEMPNLGSVFRNPGKKKAWELIEEAGCRGVRVGQARVSEKHANFIVNEGDAKAKDVLILIGLVKDKVKEASGILLETEIKVVGE
ncbi:MAG: UDP-N-acetylenolpyruvoylglucosamine reductase [Deltaproteobacteria bacterium RIFCSPLOWO2_02_FULL_53_8]|nr:MAG: UDP-N-acetylenolpyruvoylglucosamine reductase [Deltaproteobacteria bacterium RIFCSPLOWO2_02_FULL_53_8]